MYGKLNWCISGAVALAIAFGIRAVPASAQSIEEKAQTCAGCHGEDGKPVDKTIPAIWGQQLGYIYIQLRDFKRGDRKNDIMQPIASSMEREDMLAIAEYLSKKPWLDLGQPRAPKEIAGRALRANISVGTADRDVGAQGATCDFLWRTGLTKIRPWLFREIFRDS